VRARSDLSRAADVAAAVSASAPAAGGSAGGLDLAQADRDGVVALASLMAGRVPAAWRAGDGYLAAGGARGGHSISKALAAAPGALAPAPTLDVGRPATRGSKAAPAQAGTVTAPSALVACPAGLEAADAWLGQLAWRAGHLAHLCTVAADAHPVEGATGTTSAVAAGPSGSLYEGGVAVDLRAFAYPDALFAALWQCSAQRLRADASTLTVATSFQPQPPGGGAAPTVALTGLTLQAAATAGGSSSDGSDVLVEPHDVPEAPLPTLYARWGAADTGAAGGLDVHTVRLPVYAAGATGTGPVDRKRRLFDLPLPARAGAASDDASVATAVARSWQLRGAALVL
jgi:hypothetical protein